MFTHSTLPPLLPLLYTRRLESSRDHRELLQHHKDLFKWIAKLQLMTVSTDYTLRSFQWINYMEKAIFFFCFQLFIIRTNEPHQHQLAQ